ncbi:MAG: hypothetical protein V4660_06245 [Pseudomonadota bacterium]
MLKILISLIIGVAIGTSVTLSLMPDKSSIRDTLALSTTCPATHPENKNLRGDLQQNNIALAEALKKAQDQLTKTSTSSIASHYTGQVAPDCAAEVNNAIAAFNEKDKIMTEFQSVKSLHEYDTNLSNQFNSEEPNEGRTKTIETKIYDVLRKNPDTQTIVISSLDCRSRTCKIKIPAADQSAKNQVVEAMSQPAFLKALGFNNATTRPAMEIIGGEMTFYISNSQ